MPEGTVIGVYICASCVFIQLDFLCCMITNNLLVHLLSSVFIGISINPSAAYEAVTKKNKKKQEKVSKLLTASVDIQ